MNILSWDKPKKVRPTKVHNEMYVADGVPPGAYISNMSAKDIERWKAKITGTRRGKPQVEIRKDGFVIVVGLKGYKYKHYDTTKQKIHIASAGPIMMSFEEFEQLKMAVDEAKEVLSNL